MADKPSQPATSNGLIFIDGQWYMQCGNTNFPVKLHDASGKPVPPPETAVLKVSST